MIGVHAQKLVGDTAQARHETGGERITRYPRARPTVFKAGQKQFAQVNLRQIFGPFPERSRIQQFQAPKSPWQAQ